MTTIKIPITKSIIQKIQGKTLKNFKLLNDVIELEFEECHLENEVKKLQKELDDGKGIELDVDKLEERYLL